MVTERLLLDEYREWAWSNKFYDKDEARRDFFQQLREDLRIEMEVVSAEKGGLFEGCSRLFPVGI